MAEPEVTFEERAVAEADKSEITVPPGAPRTDFTGGPRPSPFFDQRQVGDILNRTAATTTDQEAAALAPKAKGGPEETSTPPAEAEKQTAPASESSAGKPDDQGTLLEEDEKPAPMRGVDLSRLPGYKVEGQPDDVGSIRRIVEKYQGDPEKIANALLHHQRFESSRDRELRELRTIVEEIKSNRQTEPEYEDYEDEEEQPKTRAAKPGRPKGSPNQIDVKAEIAAIKQAIKNEEIDVADGMERIAEIMERAAEVKAREHVSRLERQQAEALQEQTNVHNARVYVDRARAILVEAARRDGQTQLVERYSNPDYELTEEEYRVAQPRLQQEFEMIQHQFRIPDGGRVNLRMFEQASRLLDPEDYERQIRLDERRKLLDMMKRGRPVGTRVETTSGATQARSPVSTSEAPPANASDYTDYQKWFLSQPREVRDRILRERGLSRH